MGVHSVQGGGGGVGSVGCMEVQIVWCIDEHLGEVVVLSDRGAVKALQDLSMLDVSVVLRVQGSVSSMAQ